MFPYLHPFQMSKGLGVCLRMTNLGTRKMWTDTIQMLNILFDSLRRIFYNIYRYAHVNCKKQVIAAALMG
jgi:hypothetical protein